MPTKRILVKQEVATYAQCLLEAAQAADRVFEDIEDIKNVRTAVVKSSQVREFLQRTSRHSSRMLSLGSPRRSQALWLSWPSAAT